MRLTKLEALFGEMGRRVYPARFVKDGLLVPLG